MMVFWLKGLMCASVTHLFRMLKQFVEDLWSTIFSNTEATICNPSSMSGGPLYLKRLAHITELPKTMFQFLNSAVIALVIPALLRTCWDYRALICACITVQPSVICINVCFGSASNVVASSRGNILIICATKVKEICRCESCLKPPHLPPTPLNLFLPRYY